MSVPEKGTAYEVALLCFTCPVLLLLRHNILAFFFSGGSASVRCQFIVDFLCLALAGLLGITLLSSHGHLFVVVLFTMTGILSIMLLDEKRTQHEVQSELMFYAVPDMLALEMPQRMRFVTYFRAFVLLSSAMAILGVDFLHIFPSRFSKTVTYGTSLMDVGVGAFTIASGLLCPQTKTEAGFKRTRQNTLKTIRSTTPLWLLGIYRAAVSYFTKYHVRPVEYGLYWNFFLTLASVKIAATLIFVLVPPRYSLVIALLIIVGYEFSLEVLGLSHIIRFSTTGLGSREGFFDANREGLCSCVGYLVIYLTSVNIGRFLATTKRRFRNWLQTLIACLLLTAILWLLLVYSCDIFDRISRRMANLTFTIWMMAHHMFLLSAFLVVDLTEVVMQYLCITYRTSHSQPEFCLMEAINRNGLFFFLLANILTGIINFVMKPSTCGPIISYSVMVIYMLFLSVSSAFLHMKNITIKWW